MAKISVSIVTVNGAVCSNDGSHIVSRVRDEEGDQTNIAFTPEQCSKLMASVSSAFADARQAANATDRRIPIPAERWEVALIDGPKSVWSFLLMGGMHLSFQADTSRIRPMRDELKKLEEAVPHLVPGPQKAQ